MDATLQQLLATADTEADAAYDEGLVHAHGWACAEGASTEQTVAQAEQQPQSAWREDAADAQDEGDAYDDGLVHGHDWASSR